MGLRERELGIRAALGASRRSLIALITHQGMTFAGLGLALVPLISRRLEVFLFGTSPTEWTIFAAAAALACHMPARRAASVDPAHTLRQD